MLPERLARGRTGGSGRPGRERQRCRSSPDCNHHHNHNNYNHIVSRHHHHHHHRRHRGGEGEEEVGAVSEETPFRSEGAGPSGRLLLSGKEYSVEEDYLFTGTFESFRDTILTPHLNRVLASRLEGVHKLPWFKGATCHLIRLYTKRVSRGAGGRGEGGADEAGAEEC